MAFEHFTSTVFARVSETHDPGSADAYLRLTNAAEAWAAPVREREP